MAFNLAITIMNVRITKNSKAILLLLGFEAFMPIGVKAQKADSIKKDNVPEKANSVKQAKRVIITLNGTFKGSKDSTNFTQIPANNLPTHINSAPVRKKHKNSHKDTTLSASQTASPQKTDVHPKTKPKLKKTKVAPAAKKPAQKTKNNAQDPPPNPLKPNANLNDRATENDSGYVDTNGNNDQKVGFTSNPAKTEKKNTVSFVWIGAILIVIGMLLGFIVNRLGFILSAVGLILILIGVFIF